ncbi:YlmC/YmxH family sporulation protein [Tepidibacillus fermentans]|uniref:YlmC/YmxH family sporulation protein n=1 Tax=Tepidibacillus fermentans TaxID=1281767 RepID=A0A4R3KKI6_9BACI|nr:YlmC/YmxH family sporulation protein [Tepidibacillus fermentans]TCS84401.1 YlmC/YmxH family sporulation protein [Tepidibacillus fermentans]
MIKISEFQTKDVVNIYDGKKLGTVQDIEIDLKTGRVEALVIPNQGKLFGLFGNGTEYIIPWRNIVKIGLDVVLVKLDDHRSFRSLESNEDSDPFKKY